MSPQIRIHWVEVGRMWGGEAELKIYLFADLCLYEIFFCFGAGETALKFVEAF